MIKDYIYAVIGTGSSGIAVCEVLSELGARVLAFDSNDKNANALKALDNIEFIHCDSNEDIVTKLSDRHYDKVVISPGVASTGVIWQYLHSSGKEVFSDVELAWRYGLELQSNGQLAPTWLCITGTNGKTTTTGMLTSILKAAGIKACSAGNIGTPLISVIHEKKYEVLAVELSSFNLHSSLSISPVAACCLNVHEDHIDWHGSFENYVDDKARVFHNAQVACIYNCEDSLTMKMVEEADVIDGCRAVGITMSAPSVSQIGVVEDLIVDRAFITNRHTHGQVLASFDDLKHLSPNAEKIPETILQDAMFASALARSINVDSSFVSKGLKNFEIDNHRFAFVDTIDEITFIDDSKATNPHAMEAALSMLDDGKVVLLCGGDAKGADLIPVFTNVGSKIKGLVILGADHFDVLRGISESGINTNAVIVEHNDDIYEYMLDAVKLARGFANAGDTILLSPGCASIDQFDSYKHRGELFVEAVKSLKG
ncbi:UDP-N-acetylmuramoyl-L-alanine--D-glutamate ligase [Actinomyces sp. zg-332]|uniref:UDP-N-acetylmuramoyl-L-alanine--D-glutamate ligase n=1 Tax=Actinomyces sp. zg-332 TaxID=2708340 RepID=UPI00141DB06C|nr:UDP-N-acetylmuramoyl-L-alanine--D-glutamate ligase [Actinomyces sp. zg-332]QPK94425.1 UDP-N-acetylmuramoyl-L-alanine--D-glutamate ligase [Actinomyces sp. zg-332]